MDLFPESGLSELLPEGPQPADLVLLAGEVGESSGRWLSKGRSLLEAAAADAGLNVSGSFRIHATMSDGVRALRASRPSLEHALAAARPKVVVVLGAVAARALWPEAKVTQGVLKAIQINGCRARALPTVSPGAVLREPGLRPRFVEDLKTVAAYLRGEMRGWHPERLSEMRLSVCETREELDAALAEAAAAPELGIDTETRGKRLFGPVPPDRYLVTVQIATAHDRAFCIPVSHPEAVAPDGLVDALGAFLQDYKGEVYAHNSTFDQRALWSILGFVPKVTFDPMVGHSIQTGDDVGNGLKALVWTYADDLGGYEAPAEDAFRRARWDASKVPLPTLSTYGCLDAVAALRVGQAVKLRLRKRRKVAKTNRTTISLANIIAGAEVSGVLVDWSFLEQHGRETEARIATLKSEIKELCGAKFHLAERDVGGTFNFAAADHIRALLYKRMGLSTPVKTRKKGEDATSAEALAGLDHPAVECLREIAKLEQELKLYVRAWPRYRCKDDRIRPEYAIVRRSGGDDDGGAKSGRLAAKNPNVQQLRRKGGIRRAIIADSPDHALASFDFSNLEMRVVTMLSQDDRMKEFFASGGDFHKLAASAVFGIEPDTVTKEQRDIAKTLAFAVLFGAGANRVALISGVTKAEAEQFVEDYYDRFPGLKSWRRRVIAHAVKRGYVESLFGRRRYFPELQGARRRSQMNDDERKAFSHALRALVNHMVQSAGADICFDAAVRVSVELPRGPERPRFSMTVHDELLYNILKEWLSEMVPLIQTTMRNGGLDFVKGLGVSIEVSAKVGNNFKELTPYAVAE